MAKIEVSGELGLSLKEQAAIAILQGMMAGSSVVNAETQKIHDKAAAEAVRVAGVLVKELKKSKE